MGNESKKMDWHLLWTATAVIVSLGSLIFGCFKSLSNDVKEIERRLTVIETTLILKEIMPYHMACEEKK